MLLGVLFATTSVFIVLSQASGMVVLLAADQMMVHLVIAVVCLHSAAIVMLDGSSTIAESFKRPYESNRFQTQNTIIKQLVL